MGGSCPGPPPGGSGSGFFTFGAIVNAATINANKSDLNLFVTDTEDRTTQIENNCNFQQQLQSNNVESLEPIRPIARPNYAHKRVESLEFLWSLRPITCPNYAHKHVESLEFHGLSAGASQRWGSHREIVCPTITLAEGSHKKYDAG